MTRFFAKKWPPFLVLGIATLLVWGHSVGFGFVWDDDFFIRDLPSVRSLRHIPEMFYRLDAQATLPDFVVFRPIRTAHYALLYFLEGQPVPQPWIFHLANVLWHGATAMLLFAVLVRLLPRLSKTLSGEGARFWAFWVALAFAVHPVVSEVVCWAKSLDDILATFFTLATLRELLLPPESKAARWRALIFFALAVYSKESAVPFAILPLLVCRKIHQLPWKQSLIRTTGFFFIAMIYMAHRALVIGRNSQTEPISGTYAQTLLDMLPIVPKYVRLLFGIPPFCIDYSYLHGGYLLWSPEVVSGLALLSGLVWLGILAWRKPGLEPVGFGLLWTGLFLLPVSNLLPMMQYMAERFLYLPLIGWLIALAVLAARAPRQRIIHMAAGAVMLLWAVTAWNRSWIWQDRVTLFVRSSQENPKTKRVEDNAVAAILDLPQVRSFFASDTAGKTAAAGMQHDLTTDKQVVATLAEACRLFPTNHNLLSYYGMSLAATGQPEKGLPLLEQAAAMYPKSLNRWLNLARAALAANQPTVAAAAMEKAGVLAPENPVVLQLRFNYFWQRGDYPAARQSMLKLNQIEPTEEHAHWLSEAEKKLKSSPGQ